MTDRYEMLICKDGLLEIRNPENEDRWITTDSPAELRR